jgi:hypothetical protein
MNDITLLREAGPDAPRLTNDTLSAARAALLDEIEGARPAGRFRMPSRKARWRVGVGVVAVAASWAAAVVIAAPDPVGPPPDSVRLVGFEPPTFPLSLDPVPAGWDVSFSADPGGILHAAYGDEASDDGLYVRITPEEPEQYDVTGTTDVTVAGEDAELVRGEDIVCGGTGTECVDERIPYLHLVWERRDDQWVQLTGYGTYDDADRLVDAAEHLVDRPQPVPLQISLAPAGWSVDGYKDDRILTLANDEYEQQSLTVHIPLPDEVIPLDQVRDSIAAPLGPQLDVTVNGRPAQLVRTEGDYVIDGHRYLNWYLQGQFEDGTTFVLQAPEAFTREQVLELAESVTYNP